MLNNAEKDLITRTYIKINAERHRAAMLFYHRFLELAPDARPLFASSDMYEQGRVFMNMLDRMVRSIYLSADLNHELDALGQRHIRYGVKNEHFDKMEDALIWTIEQLLGDTATLEITELWRKVYRLMAETVNQIR